MKIKIFFLFLTALLLLPLALAENLNQGECMNISYFLENTTANNTYYPVNNTFCAEEFPINISLSCPEQKELDFSTMPTSDCNCENQCPNVTIPECPEVNIPEETKTNLSGWTIFKLSIAVILVSLFLFGIFLLYNRFIKCLIVKRKDAEMPVPLPPKDLIENSREEIMDEERKQRNIENLKEKKKFLEGGKKAVEKDLKFVEEQLEIVENHKKTGTEVPERKSFDRKAVEEVEKKITGIEEGWKDLDSEGQEKAIEELETLKKMKEKLKKGGD